MYAILGIRLEMEINQSQILSELRPNERGHVKGPVQICPPMQIGSDMQMGLAQPAEQKSQPKWGRRFPR